MQSVPGHRNLKIRGGVYYWRETIKGRKFYESLHTPCTGRQKDLKEAVDAMKVKQRLARDENFSALENTRTKTTCPTIGKVIERYQVAATAYRVKPSTITNNINKLKVIIRAGYADDPLKLPCSILTDELMNKYRDAALRMAMLTKEEKKAVSRKATTADMRAAKAAALVKMKNKTATASERATASRTIQSTKTQAKAIFADWTYSDYKSLKLPDLTGFKCGGVIRAETKRYALPAHELIDKTVKAGRGLKTKNPPLYLAFLLAYDLGLRPEEIIQCQRHWFRVDDRGIHWLGILPREDEQYKPKTPRSIPVPASVYADLMKLGGKTTILAGSLTARKKIIAEGMMQWMRGLGWTREKFAYELRKLRGSFWRSKYGLDRAHDWLGHSNYQTTINHYSKLPDEPEPYPVDDDLNALRKR